MQHYYSFNKTIFQKKNFFSLDSAYKLVFFDDFIQLLIVNWILFSTYYQCYDILQSFFNLKLLSILSKYQFTNRGGQGYKIDPGNYATRPNFCIKTGQSAGRPIIHNFSPKLHRPSGQRPFALWLSPPLFTNSWFWIIILLFVNKWLVLKPRRNSKI